MLDISHYYGREVEKVDVDGEDIILSLIHI